MERWLLDGRFHFKKLQDGSVDKTKAVCTDCQAEFSYHRSTSSLNYHIMQAKHTASSSSVSSVNGSSSSIRSDNRNNTCKRIEQLTGFNKIETVLFNIKINLTSQILWMFIIQQYSL